MTDIPTYYQKYGGVDNYGKPKVEFLERLSAYDAHDLFLKCKTVIWLSAFANNNPRSDYHWQCDACYDECQHRNRPDIYTDAHKYVSDSL